MIRRVSRRPRCIYAGFKGTKPYRVAVAKAEQDIDEAVSLPDPVRRVLGSVQKLQILCLIESGVVESDAISPHMPALKRQSINLHLNELEALGWIRIADLRKIRGSYARVWELTDPSFSWRALVEHLRTQIPAPAPPVADSTTAS